MAHLALSTASFAAADTLIAGGRDKRQRPIGHNTVAIRRGPDAIAVRYWSTDIVTMHRDGSIAVTLNGYNTVTTLQRVNYLLPAPWRVASYRQRGQSRAWLWAGGYPVTPFVDGLTIHPDTGAVSYDGAVILTADDIAAIRSAAEAAQAERERKRIARYAAQHAAQPYASSDAFRHRWDCKACTALREAEREAHRARLSAEHDAMTEALSRATDAAPWTPAEYAAAGSHIRRNYYDGSISHVGCPWDCPQR